MQPVASNVPPLTPEANAALDKLADVAMPPPPSWTPQTWGWAVLAAVVLALFVWTVVRVVKRRRANRYRVEALADLAALESRLTDAESRAGAVSEMPALVKRVALAAWPRPEVAALSGASWIAFLRAHAGRARLDGEAATLLAEDQYRPEELRAIDGDKARRIASGLRRWIEGHRVRP